MKAKMSSAGMKGIFVQHAEKMVLGLTVLLLGFFFWSAFRLAPLSQDKSPKRLEDQVRLARGQIDESTPPTSSLVPQDWNDKINLGLEPVSVGTYAFATEFDRPKVPAIVKRPDPALFPLEDLQATAVIISVPVQPGVQAPAPPLIVEKATKTPAVPPIKSAAATKAAEAKADAEAKRTLKYNKSSSRDEDSRPVSTKQVPANLDSATSTEQNVRLGAIVNGAQGEVRNAVVLVGRVPYAKQMAEFQSRFSDAAAPPNHTLSNDTPFYSQFKIERQEVGAPEKPWVVLDVGAAHRDSARWAVMPSEVVATLYVDTNLTRPLPPTLARDWGRLATHPSIPLASAIDVGTAEQANLAAELPAAGPFAKRPGSKTGQAVGEGQSSGREGEGTSASNALQAHVPYFLFRYVDFERLVPGKQYRYRVALELENPNYEMPAGLLENVASQKNEARWTAPGDPSKVVTIGRPKRLLASSIKPGKTFTETAATFQIHAWDRQKGFEVATVMNPPLQLGGIVELVDKVATHLNPALSYVVEDLGSYTFKFDPVTEAGPPMLADVRGGMPMPGGSSKIDRVNQPVELMFFDVAGRVLFTNEAIDAADVKFYDARYTDKSGSTPAAAGGLFEGEGPTLFKGPKRSDSR